MGLNIRLEGIKRRHVTLNELDNVTIYSHANKFGNGRERVTLKFARTQFKDFRKVPKRRGYDNESEPGQSFCF